jgi:catechol 2,3-dioxygenase-like lactoylglutathione lyase family enzyme
VLRNPSRAVIGSSDLEASARFLAVFDLEVEARGEMPPAASEALYGLPGGAGEWILSAPGAATGGVRLVRTPHPARPAGTFDTRAFALDFYTRDITRSLARAREAGYAAGDVAEHRFGPAIVREAEVHGPDGITVTLLGLDTRRPSRLDREPERLHSEVHSFVWSVTDTDRVAAFWEREAGLRRVTDARFGGTTLSRALGLPEREIAARFLVLTDADDHPIRVQLIEFLVDETIRAIASLPLAAGPFGLAFDVPSLEGAVESLPGARFGAPVAVGSGPGAKGRAVAGAAPGELRFELWEPA